jgi:hypothetical protein
MRASFTHHKDHRLYRDSSVLPLIPQSGVGKAAKALPTIEILDYIETVQYFPWFPSQELGKRPSFTHHRAHRLYEPVQYTSPDSPVMSWECGQALPTKEIIDNIETVLYSPWYPPSHLLGMMARFTHHWDNRLYRDSSSALSRECGQALPTKEIIDYVETILHLVPPPQSGVGNAAKLYPPKRS